jgi:hypothetical protein
MVHDGDQGCLTYLDDAEIERQEVSVFEHAPTLQLVLHVSAMNENNLACAAKDSSDDISQPCR